MDYMLKEKLDNIENLLYAIVVELKKNNEFEEDDEKIIKEKEER